MAVPSSEVMKEFKAPVRGIELRTFDWVWAVSLILFASLALYRYHGAMEIYELVIFCVAAVSLIAGGWIWKSLRPFGLVIISLSLIAVYIYHLKVPALMASGMSGPEALDILSSQGDPKTGNPQKNFFLAYFLASKVATMWMSVLFITATIFYFIHLWLKSENKSSAESVGKFASQMTWTGCVMGFVAMLVRWRETHIVDLGRFPVSNLYEVFILFAALTALMYLFYEQRFKTRTMGGFAMLIVSAIVAFLLWYHGQGQHEIKPLLPALDSWWMKIHVPANFIGYGAFALAAMVGILSLLAHYGRLDDKKTVSGSDESNDAAVKASDHLIPAKVKRLAALSSNKRSAAIVGIFLTFITCLLFGLYGGYKQGKAEGIITMGPVINSAIVALVLIAIGWFMLRPSINRILPTGKLMEDMMFKSIALGFFGFTIATILGSAWASSAWSKYWSWDPKEVWALIVWLNYAAWLHVRYVVGRRDTVMAWWAIVGLFLTTFAFLGVNIFLSGLHTYGEL